MPEGPEVRVVADIIEASAVGKTIATTVVVQNVVGTSHRYDRKKPDNWELIAEPFTICQVSTKGKLIKLSIKTKNNEDYVLLVTLGMSGDFRYNSSHHKHCRYAFKFADGGDLSFVDVRCFGTLRIVHAKNVAKIESKIGWDLLQAPMPTEMWKNFKYKLSSLEIGEALLQQKNWSGIGNIYRAEILYRLGINPFKPLALVKEFDWEQVNHTAHRLLKEAYTLGGCSVADFTANGQEGRAQQLLQIYGQNTCPRDHTVKKEPQATRSIWYCGICQP